MHMWERHHIHMMIPALLYNMRSSVAPPRHIGGLCGPPTRSDLTRRFFSPCSSEADDNGEDSPPSSQSEVQQRATGVLKVRRSSGGGGGGQCLRSAMPSATAPDAPLKLACIPPSRGRSLCGK